MKRRILFRCLLFISCLSVINGQAQISNQTQYPVIATSASGFRIYLSLNTSKLWTDIVPGLFNLEEANNLCLNKMSAYIGPMAVKWRLPTIEEYWLERKYNMRDYFNLEGNWLWSSSEHDYYKSSNWMVNLKYDSFDWGDKTEKQSVRCIGEL